jgi:uncharacterized protein
MQMPREGVLLRIFFGEDNKYRNLPLHEAIVLRAREMHMGGATVLRGHIGFGHSSRFHTTKILRLSQDLPIVVEIVDVKEKIDAFLPALDAMMSGGLVTMEKVEVLQHGQISLVQWHHDSGRAKMFGKGCQRCESDGTLRGQTLDRVGTDRSGRR